MDISLKVILDQLRHLSISAVQLFPTLSIAILVFTFFWFVATGVRLLIQRVPLPREHGRRLAVVLSRLAQIATILVGLFVALTIIAPSFKPGDLVELLGISGVAIGFVFRDILQNFLAGILILLTEPFLIEDQIVYKTIEGTVEDIQARATILRTYDGRRVVIPNEALFSHDITVNTALEKRRLDYDFGIGYGENIREVKQLILDTLKNIEGILTDPPPQVLTYDLAESSIHLRARWWIDPPRRSDELEIRDQVLTAIAERLTEQGIDMPFPTQQILLDKPLDAPSKEA